MNVTETTFRNINHQSLEQKTIDSKPEKVYEKYSVKSERLNESRFTGIKPLWMRKAINTVCEHPGTVAIAGAIGTIGASAAAASTSSECAVFSSAAYGIASQGGLLCAIGPLGWTCIAVGCLAIAIGGLISFAKKDKPN